MNYTDKPKLLYLTIRADHGGGSLHVDQLIQSFNDSYEIFCAAPLETPYGINWYNLLGKDKFFELQHRNFSFVRLLTLKSFIRKNNIRIIHSHGKGGGIYSRLLKLLHPSLIVIHTFHGFHPSNKNISNKFYIAFEKFFGKKTDYFINVSNGERDLCKKYEIVKENNSHVVYNGVKQSQVLKINKQEIRNKLCLDQKKFIVLTINRFDPHKNVTQILDIANQFKNQKEISFVIVGDGEERSILTDKAYEQGLDNIIFTGFKNNPLEYIAASDIYISASKGEALGYTLIEALMIGIPVIASNVMGHNEIIRHGENGFLFELNDIKQAKELIHFIYNNPDKTEDLISNGRNKYETFFRFEHMITKISEIYKKLI